MPAAGGKRRFFCWCNSFGLANAKPARGGSQIWPEPLLCAAGELPLIIVAAVDE